MADCLEYFRSLESAKPEINEETQSTPKNEANTPAHGGTAIFFHKTYSPA